MDVSKLVTFERETNTIICGPTSSGKTELMFDILTDGIFDIDPVRVVMCAPSDTVEDWEKNARMPAVKKRFPVTYVRDIGPIGDFLEQLTNVDMENNILILDDLSSHVNEPKFKKLLESVFYVRTHHKHMWTFLMTHNLFLPGVISLRRNTQNFMLFKTVQDHEAVLTYLRKLVGPAYINIVLDAWEHATKQPHGWIRYDLRQRAEEKRILSSGGVTVGKAHIYRVEPHWNIFDG